MHNVKVSVVLCFFASVMLAGCGSRYKHEFYPVPYKQDVSLEAYKSEYETCSAKADEVAGENYRSPKLGGSRAGGAAGSFAGGFAQGVSDGIAYGRWVKAHSTVFGRCMLDKGYVFRRVARDEKKELDKYEVTEERRKATWMFVSGQRATMPYPDDETDINRQIREGTL